jgi:hypothetical protein
MHTTVSKSRRTAELSGSITRSEHISVEPAVLPSQVEQLPDLAGYLKIASDPRWLRVRLDARQVWQRRQSGSKEGQVFEAQRDGGLSSAAGSGGREFSADE